MTSAGKLAQPDLAAQVAERWGRADQPPHLHETPATIPQEPLPGMQRGTDIVPNIPEGPLPGMTPSGGLATGSAKAGVPHHPAAVAAQSDLPLRQEVQELFERLGAGPTETKMAIADILAAIRDAPGLRKR